MNLTNKFYFTHCDLDLTKDETWNLINENYKRFIDSTEEMYKPYVKRAVLGIMEVLEEERKQNC